MFPKSKCFLRCLFGAVMVALLFTTLGAPILAQTAPAAKVSFRPMTRDDIAAYKLPSTTQVSGGLSTVGIGEPLYLEALIDIAVPTAEIVSVDWAFTRKPADSQADFQASPLPAGAPIYEPGDRLAFQVAGRTLLRPDVAGVYQFQATIVTAKSGIAVVPLLVTAGTYLGAAACANCHSGGSTQPWNMSDSWSNTKHSSMFKNGINGVLGSSYGSGCIACHTVGYDANAAATNGNFADVAKKLNWVFPSAVGAGAYDKVPDELKALAGIQCENCHGPGSQHVKSGGDPLQIAVSMESGACGQCHGALTHHSKTGEWLKSGHAMTTRDPSGTGREGCVGCHTGMGFIDRVNGVTPPRTAYSAINCQTCHEPHGQTLPADGTMLVRTVNSVTLKDGTVLTDGGKGLLCMNCHQARQNAEAYVATTAGNSHYGAHHGPQADMLAGVNAVQYGKAIPTSAHGYVVEDTCVGCHMQAVDATSPTLTNAGGHTFKPSWTSPTGKVDLVAECQKCHGKTVEAFNFPLLDYDGDGQVDGVQTEVQHLLDQLSAKLPPVGQPKTALTIDATWTRAQLKAAYNWQFVTDDGSRGIHNMAYTVGILKASIADLAAQK